MCAMKPRASSKMSSAKPKKKDYQDSSLFFNDGHAVSRNTLLLAGQFNAYPSADVSRLALLIDGQWRERDVRGDSIRSVTFHAPDRRCYFMGRNGLIVTGGNGQPFSVDNLKGTFNESTIPDVQKFGELFRIRSVSDQVLACGQSSQIYRLNQGKWEHFDKGLLAPEAETLEDLGGTGPDNIFAVGMCGTLAHFNGKKWRRLESPTEHHLSNVLCISPNEIYFCGNDGALFRGDGKKWKFIGNPKSTGLYWGLAKFRGSVYVASDSGIEWFDGKTLLPVRIPLKRKKKYTFHRLQVADDRLFSFGVDDVLSFDGTKWEEYLWPGNT